MGVGGNGKMVKRERGSHSWEMAGGHLGSKMKLRSCISASEGVVLSRRVWRDTFILSMLFLSYFPILTLLYNSFRFCHPFTCGYVE